jgi:hypothetical protein
VKLLRAERPQTKREYYLLVAEETEKQFVGIRVKRMATLSDWYYFAAGKNWFGVEADAVAGPSHLNKFHCTNYTVTEVDESKVKPSTVEEFRRLKKKIKKGEENQ